MTRHHVCGLLLCLLVLVAAGCQQTSIAERERVIDFQTLVALTPSSTPTPVNTNTPTPTPTLTPTLGPSPTPSNTPVPSPTPLPPTATPNPALAKFSLCTQVAGNASSGRFSAQIRAITTTVQSAFERVTFELNVPGESAPPYATVSCVSSDDIRSPQGSSITKSPYILRIDMAGWLHDEAFRTSVQTPTHVLSGTTILKSITYRYAPNDTVGAALEIGLDQPLPFRVNLLSDPYRLVLEVAKTTAIGPSSDMLSLPAGGAIRPDTPLFFLRDGDIWRFSDGKAANLTNSPEVETGLAVSLVSRRVAFCRASTGASIGDSSSPSTLWQMDFDGKDQNELAAPGHSCIDPVFSPDGQTIAFTVDESGATPPRLSIWSVAINGGTGEQRLTSPDDEWSRFGPQWLDRGKLVYTAVSEDGRSTLFLRTAEGQEQDIGADLVKGDRYRLLGRALSAPSGTMVAVEALRATEEGADLVLLDSGGVVQDTIGGSYWTRPVAWAPDGTLFYLTSACASDVIHDYTLHTRTKDGTDRTIAIGTTLGGFGSFASVGKGLAYVALAHVPPGPRGPLRLDWESASVLWFWDVVGGTRVELVKAPAAITDLAPASGVALGR